MFISRKYDQIIKSRYLILAFWNFHLEQNLYLQWEKWVILKFIKK